MKHNELNRKIYPIYKKYKEQSDSLEAYQLLKMWSDIGDHINNYLKKNPNITKSKLFRELYGKSEGAENISRIGYISREFLQRAHRVYLMELNNQLDIEKDLQSLNAIGPFREAMPFFDNKKYIFKGEKREDLLNLLNSNLSSTTIVDKVRALQKKYIKITNPRTQRLADLRNEAKLFLESYNHIYDIYKSNNYKSLSDLNKDNIVLLSEYIRGLTSENFLPPEDQIKKFNYLHLDNLKELVEFLFKSKDAKIRRRFRRLIPISRTRQLSKYIYSLKDQVSFESMRNTII